MTANQIAYQNMLENRRRNQAVEFETARHNVAGETLGIANLSETSRHNVIGERVDLSRLQETQRHNITAEGLQSRSINLGYAQLGLGYDQLAESKRHNIVGEITKGVDVVVSAINPLSKLFGG